MTLFQKGIDYGKKKIECQFFKSCYRYGKYDNNRNKQR